MVVRLFDLNVNKKLHHTMRHIHDHILSFGIQRRGSKYDNEILHKYTKAEYRVTNRRVPQLPGQLLAARKECKKEEPKSKAVLFTVYYDPKFIHGMNLRS